MPRFEVEVLMEKTVRIKVWAKDKFDAGEAAAAIVSEWQDVHGAEARQVDEIEDDRGR